MEIVPSKKNRDVAVVFDDLTEFFALRNDIDSMTNNNIGVDIYVIRNYSEEMQNVTQRKIAELGYLVKSTPSANIRYKILLEPYPITDNQGFDYEFRIKYSYSASSAKPDPVFLPEWNLPYDASISYSLRDSEIRSVYNKAYTVKYSKYANFKKEKNSGKPNLLYLPTFGEISSINALDDKATTNIKQKYNLIIKAHHAVQFNAQEQVHYDSIKKMADEFYDSDTPLEKLLSRADVVLSDNSGAIFESIYSETPVAIFSNKLNSRKLGRLNTFQHELVEDGIIPCAKKAEEIVMVLEKAVTLAAKQKEAKQLYFIETDDSSQDDFVSVIKEYLSKDRRKEMYFVSHDILQSTYSDNIHKIKVLEESRRQLQERIENYENSVSWKITQPLRKISHLARRKKHE